MFTLEILFTILLFGGYYLGMGNTLFAMGCAMVYVTMVACRYAYNEKKEKEYKRRIARAKKYRKEAEVA